MAKKLTEQEQQALQTRQLNRAIDRVRRELKYLDSTGSLAGRLARMRGNQALWTAKQIAGHLDSCANLGIRPKLDQVNGIIAQAERTEFK